MTQDELVELCTTIGERDANRARITELEESLRRTLRNFCLLLEGKPVRDAEETIAEATRLLD